MQFIQPIILLSFLVSSSFAADSILPNFPNFHPCHEFLTESEGHIRSPNYPEKYPISVLCHYDISRGLEGCGVRIKIEDFELGKADPDGFCKGDFLAVHSCVPEGGSRFCGKISGATYEYAFQPEATHFRLTFKADNRTRDGGKGFRIQYQVMRDCDHGLFWQPPIGSIPNVDVEEALCFTQVTETKGTINTPFFPRHYPNNMDCVYEFLRESPFVCGVRMRVLTFDLEKSVDTDVGGACADFFHMIGGCGFMCGNVRFIWTAKYQPGATSLKFHFHSDEGNTRPGFQIAFEQMYNCA